MWHPHSRRKMSRFSFLSFFFQRGQWDALEQRHHSESIGRLHQEAAKGAAQSQGHWGAPEKAWAGKPRSPVTHPGQFDSLWFLESTFVMTFLTQVFKLWLFLFRSWKCRRDSMASPRLAASHQLSPPIPPSSCSSSSSRFPRATRLSAPVQTEPLRTSSVWVQPQPSGRFSQPHSFPHHLQTPRPAAPSAAPWIWAAWALPSWTTAPHQRSTPMLAWETLSWTMVVPCPQIGQASPSFLLCHRVPPKPAATAALIWTRTCDTLLVVVRRSP